MYFVMYTMLDRVSHLYLNINDVYMTLMMIAPMAVVMLISMRAMSRRPFSTEPLSAGPSWCS
ncbi:hypothetical protein [Luteitalea sp.]